MAKAISKCLCNKSTKSLFVKIVHPGGHKELHDRPILASQIMLRNPKCIVAYPHVFEQPWAIVPPETLLLQGHKFYVVPISTIKKLQTQYLKHSSSPLRDINKGKEEDINGKNKNMKALKEDKYIKIDKANKGYCI
ncbi:hypothetical protein JCGZ_27020 [Jatropha curcas]|uniref:Uncharacterized protein n=1 Tax=Jatropha curcas TaxID=180498 RepID=A0A067L0P7_JATCU|nr:hypothetical protein JCGZ_27020 [Jatropha curcas]